MLDKKLDFIIKGGLTKRYHTQGTIHEQNVAEHSFFVAWLIILMYGSHKSLGHLLHLALFHDIAEGSVGDVASPVKRRYPDLSSYLHHAEAEALEEAGMLALATNNELRKMLKMADNMEGLLHCAEEIRRGNTDAIEIYNNFLAYTLALEPEGKELDLLIAIKRRITCQMLITTK